MPFLALDPRHAPARGVAGWLATELRTAIVARRLVAGEALPPTRVLAEELGVSRGTVVEAYARLGEEGLVAARTGHGTVVLAPAGGADEPAAAPVAGPRPELDLSPTTPDPRDFPTAAWLRHERAVLDGAGLTELGYGDPQGDPGLRRELAGWLGRTRGMRVRAEDVLVVNGVAQAFALLAAVLVAEGRPRLGVEDPGSVGAYEHFRHWGMELVPAPVDADGADVDAWASQGCGAVLLTPAHQFPTGTVLSGPRRRRLLQWAAAEDVLVVEDDYDAELRYDRTPVAALQPSAPHLVAQTGSVSKILAPGLRLGWVVPPPRLLPRLVEQKFFTDLSTSGLQQQVLATMLSSGDHERHVRSTRRRRRVRRDALLGAVRTHLPEAEVGGVAAGLHVTLTFPRRTGLDDRALAAALARAGVGVRALGEHRLRPGPPGLVVGYAATTPARLEEAVRRVAAVLGA